MLSKSVLSYSSFANLIPAFKTLAIDHPRSVHRGLLGSKNPFMVPAMPVVISSMYGLMKSGSKNSPIALIPFHSKSAIVLPRPFQSFDVKAATILSAISCALLLKPSRAAFQAASYSSIRELSALSRRPISPGLIPVEPVLPLPLLPLPPVPVVELSFGELRTFNSSNARMVFFSFSAVSAAFPSASFASSAASAIASVPSAASNPSSAISANASLIPPVAPPPSLLIPRNLPSHTNSLCRAITRPLI